MDSEAHAQGRKPSAARGADAQAVPLDTVRAVMALRKIIVSIAVVLAAALLLAASSFVLMPKNNQAAFGMIHQEAHGILGEPDNSIDVLFVGDSETTSSVSPLQIWSEQGFTSYVCATNGQKMPYGLALLNQALKNQAPKVVAIEANSVYAPFSLKDCVMRELQNAFPVFEYHDRWKKVSAEDFTAAPKATWTDPLKGFYINEKVLPAQAESHMKPSDAVEEVPGLNKWYLSLFANRCREAGAVPVVVATPSTICWSTARHNGMSEAARELGIDFLDLNTGPDRVEIDWSSETRDAGDHLNYQGAVKVSRSLGGLLKAAYQLPDRRQDSAYRHWGEALDSYKQTVPHAQTGKSGELA